MSGDLLVVVPVVGRPGLNREARQCLASICDPGSSFGIPPEDVLVVDNTLGGVRERDTWPRLRWHRDPAGHNLGVARSWNVGALEVLERGLDYLVLMSSVMLFGPELHCTFRWQLDQLWGADIIEADGHSWHLIALHRRLFEEIGLFDPAFYPAYEESIDWCRRLRIVGREQGWPIVWVNALSQGAAHHTGVVSCPNPPLVAYYAAKWGGVKGAETFDRPWGDKPLDYFVERPIPELAAEYGLGEHGRGWW